MKILIIKKAIEKEELLKMHDFIASDLKKVQISGSSNETEPEKSSKKEEQKTIAQSSKPKSAQEKVPVIIPLDSNCCYCIFDLHRSIDKASLKWYFDKIGVVQRVFMPSRLEKGVGAFVHFEAFFDKIPDKSFEIEIDGHRMKAVEKTSMPIDADTQSIMLSGKIGGLSRNVICDFFRQFGEVLNFSDSSNSRADGWKYVFLKYRHSSSVNDVIGKKLNES
jgi:hypothetical protein